MRDGAHGIEQRRYPSAHHPNHTGAMNTDSIRSSLFATSNGPRGGSGGGIGAHGSRPGIQMSGSSYSRPSAGGGVGSNDRLYAEQSERMMEGQNDDLTSRLADKVNILKQLSIDIGVEVKEQNRLLNDMDVDFESTQGLMKKAIGGLQNMINTGGSKHMCYLVAFIFGLFMLVYWLVR